MKQTRRWSIIGCFIIIGLGVFVHFLYDWLPYRWVGIFSPVNESIWEHLKLLFWPFIIYSLFEMRILRHKHNNYFLAKTIGLYFGLISIIVFYYTIQGAFGKPGFFIDFLIYIVSIIITQRMSYRMMKDRKYRIPDSLSLALIGLLLVSLIVFTYYPPHIPLFQDPETKQYGINK